ncbi:hypothetical protein AK812_SmicGene18135 [Symbiodinium microadriaticum]|uniref:Uncharacterized protein n=1 Tax=Symbiodinium microadriaticum TaxID=2951 RepID=A0A1Q9DVY7_SYMMI|nr:hypothetical protein AK812_SmicGene18135 [Symbiodinium microadriaticum]
MAAEGQAVSCLAGGTIRASPSPSGTMAAAQERQLEQDSIAKKLAFIDWKVAAGQSIGDGYAPLALCDWEAQEVEEPQPALTISPASETWQAYDADESYKYDEDLTAATRRIYLSQAILLCLCMNALAVVDWPLHGGGGPHEWLPEPVFSNSWDPTMAEWAVRGATAS